MADLVLWRRLTRTDFEAMSGEAAPSGTGGGAMHIALGTDRVELPIAEFLGANNKPLVTIKTEAEAPKV